MLYQQLQQVADLNLTGANLLAKNDAGSAVKAFKAALEIMQRLAMEPEVSEQMILSNKEQLCSAVELPLWCNTFYIFNKALIFNVSQQIDLGFCNAAIMFNLALALHQYGLKCNKEDKLRKAIHIYSLCCKLVGDDKTVSSGFLLLSCMNNKAQIQYNLAEYAQARHGLDELRACADLVVAKSVGSANESSPFQPQVLDEMFLNVTLTEPPTTAPMA